MRFLLGFCLIFLLVCSAASAQVADIALPFSLKRIAPNVWAAIDDAKGDAGANAGFIIGDGGVAVVDTFENEAAAQALLREIRKLTDLPILFVINTHYHLDHVAGNGVFAKEGAAIVGHQSLRAWIHTENLKFFGDKITLEQKAQVASLVAPDVTYNDGLTLYLGTRRIEVSNLEGHTGGDSVVSVPDSGLVFCGDLFWRRTLPNLIDATTASWVGTLTQLTEIPADIVPDKAPSHATIFVPGHGDVGDASDVQDFRSYLIWLRHAVEKSATDGREGDTLVAAVLPELKDKYGSWMFFEDFSRSNILDAAAELQGVKRVPPRRKSGKK
jgi:cyclase